MIPFAIAAVKAWHAWNAFYDTGNSWLLLTAISGALTLIF